jgi:hypothetical protein
MKSRLLVALFCVGLLFFFQAGVLVAVFQSTSRAELERAKPRTDDDYQAALSYHNAMVSFIGEQRAGELVASVGGSLFVCLGCWMLALYLKTRRLERRLDELERDKMGTQADSGQSL